jgi:hypothetical protein
MSNAMVAIMLSLASATGGVDVRWGDALHDQALLSGPYVEVWTSDEVYRRGERAHVWFQTDRDAYVTVFRVDTDGRVRIIYPRRPWHNNYVPGGRRLEIWDEVERHAFVVNDYPGTGYLMAVASHVPVEYGSFVHGDRWDYRGIAYYGRVTGDPYVALMDLIDHLVPEAAWDAYSYDVMPYHVEQRYEYPRFLCYDCHAYATYTAWNPYRHSCVDFRVVIYDDPYYYPARVYRSTRVVYVRPRRIEARYVFRERTATEPFVTRIRERPTNPTGRREVEPRATSGTVGGAGRVPAPVRRPTTSPTPSGRRTVEPRKVEGTPERPRVNRRETIPNDPAARVQPRLERRETKPGTPEQRRRVLPTAPERKAGPPKASPQTRRPVERAKPKTPDRRKADPPKRKPPPKKPPPKKPPTP